MDENSIVAKYLDPRNPGSLSSVNTFLKNNKFEDADLVRRTLENLRTYTLHRQKKPARRRRIVEVTFPREIVCIDLLDISDLHRFNSFYKWMLVLVDSFSRYVWLYKLKNKTANSVAQALDRHFSDPSNICSRLWGDADRSFYASETKAVLDKYKVKLYSTSSPLKSVTVEIYIRIIKSKLYRYFTSTKSKRWIDIIDEIVDGLNNSFNKTIGMKPIEVNESNSSEVWHNIYHKRISTKKEVPSFKVNDLVRLTTDKSVFSKKYKAGWTEEIFRVTKLIDTIPITFEISDLSGEKVQGSAYNFELTKVTSLDPIDK
jgi:hypothetical protein